MIQRKSINNNKLSAVSPVVHEGLNSPGRPLDPHIRVYMESQFGHDFSKVRIHTNGKADESARAVNALAYTVGRDVVFQKGQYSPETNKGKRLLSHELTHTIQQVNNVSGKFNQTGLEIADRDSNCEAEADIIATGILRDNASNVNHLFKAGREHESYSMMSQSIVEEKHQISPRSISLQRQEASGEEQQGPLIPRIPIPVFDELDPMISVPDIPGIPSILRGQEVKLSTLRSALEVFRGGLPRLGSGEDICTTLLPSYETVQTGSLRGLCCPRFIRDRRRCCRPQDIGLMEFRCCTQEEVVVRGRCIRPRRVPLPTTAPSTRRTPLPRLELKVPKLPLRFGTIQSDTIDHFAVDSDHIPRGESATLDMLARQINLYRDAEVHIDGHTDSTYTGQHNQRLSERRANAVKAALVVRGVDPARLIVIGYGESQLIFPAENTEEEKARNRRVDVWLYIPPSEGLWGEELRLSQPSFPPIVLVYILSKTLE